jgi:nucleoside-diphosphate-sugar epimerase
MGQRILITGSCGLVGTALANRLRSLGAELRFLDLNASGEAHGDVRDLDRVRRAVEGCDGVVHLAAVSRVIWGEQRPEECWETNVGGLRNVLASAAEALDKPWVIFASSREVYGQPSHLPANEDCPLRPVNVYGRCKVEGEHLVRAARSDGLRACTVRLSNVFGSPLDHVDRVVPAFAQAAAFGNELRIDGADHTFDFTYVDDVVAGIATLTELLRVERVAPPPIHFVAGVPTTLLQLAELAIGLANSQSSIRYAEPRDFDVAQFFGSPERASRILGWRPTTSLEVGLHRLIDAYREQAGSEQRREVV